MKVVALISGGKDSCFNMLRCMEEGHDVVCLANLHPPEGTSELDSYMYQSVGSEGVQAIAEAMELPLYRREISGKPKCIGEEYIQDEQDEVEDLYKLLKQVKQDEPGIQGVSVGAINSVYQKKRVEDVCGRLGMTPLCFLWEHPQLELLDAMIAAGIEAIIIKVAALGLDSHHLGKTLQQMRPHLVEMHAKYGLHICGEGGEFETFVLDSPQFLRRIRVAQSRVVMHSDNAVSPVAFLQFEKLELEEKQEETDEMSRPEDQAVHG